MCTTNTLQDCFRAVCGLWAFSKHMSGCHCTLLYLPIISRFTVERKRAEGSGPIKLKGFVFLNHSQSVIQPVHPAVSLLPQPLSSSPAIWEPPLHARFLCLYYFYHRSVPNENVYTKICYRRFFKGHRLDVAVVVGCFASSNYLSWTVQLLGVLIFPFAPLLGVGTITTAI